MNPLHSKIHEYIVRSLRQRGDTFFLRLPAMKTPFINAILFALWSNHGADTHGLRGKREPRAMHR